MHTAYLSDHPVIQGIVARTHFDTVASICLGNWHDLDDATRWLRSRWSASKHGYRRRVYVEQEVAHFELADEFDAIEFALRFG